MQQRASFFVVRVVAAFRSRVFAVCVLSAFIPVQQTQTTGNAQSCDCITLTGQTAVLQEDATLQKLVCISNVFKCEF